jgi:hypothetical protein
MGKKGPSSGLLSPDHFPWYYLENAPHIQRVSQEVILGRGLKGQCFPIDGGSPMIVVLVSDPSGSGFWFNLLLSL